jgi:hypothetical protein
MLISKEKREKGPSFLRHAWASVLSQLLASASFVGLDVAAVTRVTYTPFLLIGRRLNTSEPLAGFTSERNCPTVKS